MLKLSDFPEVELGEIVPPEIVASTNPPPGPPGSGGTPRPPPGPPEVPPGPSLQ